MDKEIQMDFKHWVKSFTLYENKNSNETTFLSLRLIKHVKILIHCVDEVE